jgi:hypothetical protein
MISGMCENSKKHTGTVSSQALSLQQQKKRDPITPTDFIYF